MLILTAWPEIEKLDLDELKAAMACPIIIDGRNVFDPNTLAQKGFTYHSVGRATVHA